MKHITAIVLASMWAAHAFALDDAVNTGRFNDIAIEGYDPVAYFVAGTPVAGSKDFQFFWRGGNWRFSSDANLEMFKADPGKYAPQYGGWCAYAMSDQGRTVRIDPEAWTILEGKLYLNYSIRVRTVWIEDVNQNVKEANTFYPQTTDIHEWLDKETSP